MEADRILDDWLEAHRARLIWATHAASAIVTLYAVRKGTAIVVRYPSGGWDVFPCVPTIERAASPCGSPRGARAEGGGLIRWVINFGRSSCGPLVMGWICDPASSPEEIAERFGGDFTPEIVREIRSFRAWLEGDSETGFTLHRLTEPAAPAEGSPTRPPVNPLQCRCLVHGPEAIEKWRPLAGVTGPHHDLDCISYATTCSVRCVSQVAEMIKIRGLDGGLA